MEEKTDLQILFDILTRNGIPFRYFKRNPYGENPFHSIELLSMGAPFALMEFDKRGALLGVTPPNKM
jgi:hypothetical protein